jgi:hypothetical protein
MNRIGRRFMTICVAGVFTLGQAQAQFTQDELVGKQNTITTAVPFLMISPDSRSAAMGDAGVATSPDENSIFWNVAKLGFIDKQNGLSISYAPWLRSLVPDVSYSHISAFGKIDDRSVITGSFRFFSLGEINFRDNFGGDLGSHNPKELAVDVGYATRLNDNFSVGIALRYINSNLTGSQSVGGGQTQPGNAFAGDIAGFYTNTMTLNSGKELKYNIGLSLTNLGSKITFTTDEERDFIPMNMRLGTAWEYEIDEYNSIMGTVDFNKLLVPTPPAYDDSLGLYKGKDNDVPVIQGIFQSFGDAPGGLKEEIKEINYSIGLEYWYDKQFAVRAGYFNEPETKGNRKYFTLGAGIRYKVFGLDMAYLVPMRRRHPLENQMRFSMLFDLEAFKTQGAE